MITVPVELGPRSYDVVVGAGVRHSLAAVLPRGVRRVLVVGREGSAPDVDPGVDHDVVVLPDGERAKTVDTVGELCRQMARRGLARTDALVAVGGGVVTDVAGFAASVYLRGIAYVNVPTTLLAQVDAAIGGKTGVNLPEGKNLVGTFWQPSAVLCDTETLATLPPREWASGRGEMAKYAFLVPAGAATLPLGAAMLELPLEEQVARCAAIKAAVVSADEREGEGRMVLNYGHTLGHALEAAALAADGGDGLRHGEAVAVGLVFAANLARRLGRIDDERVALHRAVVAGFDLPTRLPPGASAGTLLEYMARDKKARHDLTFVLDGPRGVEPVRGIDPEAVVATLADMGAAP
ncbi:MAG TPA: 3-dehydroquinate synthase family protein [Acidimicrobiales bacterium]|nr:3-dehydroquinate synthase family protein [Acidimicrobiales bacterium]